MNSRRCYAELCTEQVKRGMLMCPDHWRLVPFKVRVRVLTAYRAWKAGVSKETDREYLAAINLAREEVAKRETID